MKKAITVSLACVLLAVMVLPSFLSVPSSVAVAQNQIIVDGTLGTVPTSLEPYCGTYSCVLPVNNLVGYWKFDTGSGSTTGDNSGNGNTGTLVNSPAWLTGSSAKFGGALSFNGNSQKVTVSTTLVASASTITETAWFKINGKQNSTLSPSFGNIVYAEVGSINHPTLRITTGTNYINFGGFGSCAGTTALNDSLWHFAVGIYISGGTSSLYVDNSLVCTATSSTSSGSVTLVSIGGGADGYCNCSIDDVRIYNTALTATQISDLYNYYPSGNGYYIHATTNAFIYTESQNALNRLTQYTVDGGTPVPITNYGEATLLSYTQLTTADHHWVFSSTATVPSVANSEMAIFIFIVIMILVLGILPFFIGRNPILAIISFFGMIVGIYLFEALGGDFSNIGETYPSIAYLVMFLTVIDGILTLAKGFFLRR